MNTALDGHIVAFSRDILAGLTPPTIAISNEWWNLKDRPVPSQHTVATKVSKLRLEDHSIPEEMTGAEREITPLDYIVPLALTHPLLTDHYTSPAAAYILLSARTAAWNWDAPLVPLMLWLRVSLYQMCPGVKSLPTLDMADHITVGRQTLQRHLVPRIPAGPTTPALTYIVHQTQQVPQTEPAKKKSLAERWDLQAASLYRLDKVQGP